MRLFLTMAICAGFTLGAANCFAALAQTQTDASPTTSGFNSNGSVGSGEYAAAYSNGGGSGFGGTVGASTLHLDGDSTNFYFGFDPGATLNDNAVVYLDTVSGGFADSQMDDTGDGGRAATSNLTRDSDDVFPISPDYAIVFGNFGAVVFQLNAGNTPNHLNFVSFTNAQMGNSDTLVREISLSRSTLGNPIVLNFFIAYSAGSMFNSNESLPRSTALNSGSNPGFGVGGTSYSYDDYNQFVSVPEPAAFLFGGVASILAAVAYRRRK